MQTARTVADLCTEGSLCTLSADGLPIAAPVSYRLDKEGNPIVAIVAGSPEASNIERSNRVSLLVQPISQPARGVAAVALQGSTAAAESQAEAPEGTQLVKLTVDSCVYYGGLDHVSTHAQQQTVLAHMWGACVTPLQQLPGMSEQAVPQHNAHVTHNAMVGAIVCFCGRSHVLVGSCSTVVSTVPCSCLSLKQHRTTPSGSVATRAA